MNNKWLFVFVLVNGFVIWISSFTSHPLNYVLAFMGLVGLIISFTNILLPVEDRIP